MRIAPGNLFVVLQSRSGLAAAIAPFCCMRFWSLVLVLVLVIVLVLVFVLVLVHVLVVVGSLLPCNFSSTRLGGMRGAIE